MRYIPSRDFILLFHYHQELRSGLIFCGLLANIVWWVKTQFEMHRYFTANTRDNEFASCWHRHNKRLPLDVIQCLLASPLPLHNKRHKFNEYKHPSREPSIEHNPPMALPMALHNLTMLLPLQIQTQHPSHTLPPKCGAYNSLNSHFARIVISSLQLNGRS